MINKCHNSKCSRDFKTDKKDKKFCCNDCYIQHKVDNPELYTNGRFKEGHNSWNKGKKITKIGDFMIRKETLKTGNVKSLRFINVGDGNDGIKYIRNDRYVWEQANGPIPKNYVIYHKDGRSLNDDLDNLECINFGEALSRYRALREEVYDLSNKKDVVRLIKGCKIKDRRIQKILFDMTYSSSMLTAMRYSSDKDTAQDILSNAYIKVFEKIDTFKIEGSLEGWIRKIVANTAIDYIRKNKKIYVMDTDDMSKFDGMSSEDEHFESDAFELGDVSTDDIIKEVQLLPPGYRASFNMFVFEGMSHKDIAESLGISEGTSKSNLSKARQILKKRILELVEKNNAKQGKIKEAYRNYEMEQI